MKQQQVLNCALPVWYSNFKNITLDTKILKFPTSVIKYLRSDGSLYLPTPSSQQGGNDNSDEGVNNDIDNCNQDTNSDEEAVQSLFLERDFKEFHTHVDDTIKEFGGRAFPKLNWSAPKDASWIAMNNSLCCHSFIDICLLLKSSDFVMHDLTQPFLSCSDSNFDSTTTVEYALVLREWTEISPSGEYRCFVKDRKLVAITQRHLQYFKFIESSKVDIVKLLKRFARQHILNKFPDASFTFDVYMTSSSVLLIDFNPYGEITDPLLFTWDELNSSDYESNEDSTIIDEVAFRFVPSEGASTGDGMGKYAFPVDFQHLATGEDPAKLIDLIKLQEKQ